MNSNDTIVKLSKVSKPGRRVLLARFLLRILGEIVDTVELKNRRGSTILEGMALSIVAMDLELESSEFIEPRYPENQPIVYAVRSKRFSYYCFTIETSSGSDVTVKLGNGPGPEFVKEYKIAPKAAFELLGYEVDLLTSHVLGGKTQSEFEITNHLRRQPLWGTIAAADNKSHQNLNETNRTRMALVHANRETSGAFEFWLTYFDSIVSGQLLEQDLLRRIAKIHQGTWINGAKAIANEIERIQAQLQVETALADLKSNSQVQTKTRHGIGGNNPPESIQDEFLVGSVTLIWEAERELSTALEDENPAREWIEAILAKFKSGLASFLRWCASKGDLAVDTLIKWGIPAAGAGYAAKYPEKIEALIEAIEHWLPFLS